MFYHSADRDWRLCPLIRPGTLPRTNPHRLSAMRSAPVLGSLLLGLFVIGCSTSQPATSERPPPSDGRSLEAIEQQLRSAAADWQDVPHEWGGTTKRGTDCSGLVYSVYRDSIGRTLPRTTRGQSQVGTPVRRSALAPGDLVFFHVNTKKGRHVGIYLSDGDFLHASSSQGVTVSQLDNPYWTDRWWQARRILSLASTTVPSDSNGRSPSHGW